MSTNTIRHNIAIAEIVIFSVALLPRIRWLGSRLRQDHPELNAFRLILRLCFKISVDLICVFCQARIIGNALFLAADGPSSSLITGAVILQGIGSTPLLAEHSITLVECIKPNSSKNAPVRFPLTRLALLYLRAPIVLAIILFIVGIAVKTTASWTADITKIGSLILLAVFAVLMGISVYLLSNTQSLSPDTRSRLLLATAALPFLLVRVLYVVFGRFAVDGKLFDAMLGDWRAFVGMGFAMEAIIVGLLMAARMKKEKFRGESEMLYLTDNTSGHN